MFCLCFLKFMESEKPPSAISVIFELLFQSIIIGCGVIVNFRYWKKLLEEKRSMPINRRGNVIEPVMNWFCILQMIFWPYDLLLLWSITNQVLPNDAVPEWLCMIMLGSVKAGRMCIAYNSLFVAFIRYIHIVHYKKSNQWNYEQLSKWFKIASIGIPLAMEVLGNFTHGFTRYKDIEEIQECLESNKISNGLLVPSIVANWTMQYLPVSLVHAISYAYVIITSMVFLNIPEALLYLFVFRQMKRTNKNSFIRGVLSEKSFERGNKRRLVSLKICFMSWMYELIGVIFTILSPTLKDLGFDRVYYLDAILMFLIIPFLHLMNDEDTKSIVLEEGWMNGIIHMLGLRNTAPIVTPNAIQPIKK